MKKYPIVIILLLVSIAGVAYAQFGGGYELTWFTVDGGGEASAGEGYALSGTAGQPDAGALSGGGFELSGGFWVPALGLAAEPVLTLSKAVTPAMDAPYHGVVTYTVVLSNMGEGSDPAVTLTDTLPAGMTFAGWVISPTNTVQVGNAITWSGEIAPGAAITLTFTAAHTGDYGDAITNTAHVSGTQQAGSAWAAFTVESNGAPAADAGADQTVRPGALVTLDGSASSDPGGGALTYLWQQSGGPTVTLNDPTAGRPTFIAPDTPGVLTFTLTVTDGGGLSNQDTVEITVAPYLAYLPLVMNRCTVAPDLVVEAIIAAPDGVAVVIRNQGSAPTPATGFWVDVYVDPAVAPTRVNQTWSDLGDQGLVWGVEASLAPGEALTLTVDGPCYWPSLSAVSWPLASGAPVYAQVDSANAGTTYGGVLENHEIAGGPYNNIGSTTVAPAAHLPASFWSLPEGNPHALPPR